MSEQAFSVAFGRPPTCRTSAPGRVNLMGEHTDYNGGRVLPIAIPHRTHAWLAARVDNCVRAASSAVGGTITCYELGGEVVGRGWLDYLQGVTDVLTRSQHRLGGFDVWLESTVPMGSGLSSSAAFEVALLRGLRDLFGLTFDDVELARLGQRVETEFVGARVGIMDQMAASLADEGTALLIDTTNLSFERVTVPATLELAVIDSGIHHAHASGGYNERRMQCDEAAARLGVRHLCEIGFDGLDRLQELPELLAQRARHVITEHARVLQTVEALHMGDEAALGKLFAASHGSQRDDFAVSVPKVDQIVEVAVRDPAVVAARLTGGGFGGSVVLLVHRGEAAHAARRILDTVGKPANIVLPACC